MAALRGPGSGHLVFSGVGMAQIIGHAYAAVTAAPLLRLAGVGPLATMVFYSVSTWAVVV